MLLHLFIINRSGDLFLFLLDTHHDGHACTSWILICTFISWTFVGGLVFNRNLDTAAPNLSTNDWLRLGSTFHGLHAIAAQIAPVKSGGIEKIETSDFTLQCFQTLTGKCIWNVHMQPCNKVKSRHQFYFLLCPFLYALPTLWRSQVHSHIDAWYSRC